MKSPKTYSKPQVKKYGDIRRLTRTNTQGTRETGPIGTRPTTKTGV